MHLRYQGDLETKFLTCFKYLSGLSWGNEILQGDLMFTEEDKEMIKMILNPIFSSL